MKLFDGCIVLSAVVKWFNGDRMGGINYVDICISSIICFLYVIRGAVFVRILY